MASCGHGHYMGLENDVKIMQKHGTVRHRSVIKMSP